MKTKVSIFAAISWAATAWLGATPAAAKQHGYQQRYVMRQAAPLRLVAQNRVLRFEAFSLDFQDAVRARNKLSNDLAGARFWGHDGPETRAAQQRYDNLNREINKAANAYEQKLRNSADSNYWRTRR